MKKIVAATMALTMGFSLVSCGAEKKDTIPVESTEKKTVGISMPAQELKRWKNDGEYLKKQFESAGYEVKLALADNTAKRQNEDVNNMISDKVDLLLIAPVDGTSMADTLESAKEANIPVVSYDRLIMNSDAVTYYVSFDNYLIGKLQAKYVLDQLSFGSSSETYNIEFVAGDVSDNNARMFFNGAYDTLKNDIESGKLVVKSGMTTFERVAVTDWTTDNAEQNMKQVLKDHYPDGEKLDAVVCANDSTALGVTQALDAIYTGEKFPIITGQDGDIDNLKNIVDGKQAMTVYKNVHDEATVAFEVCKRILQGETPTGKLTSELTIPVNYDSESYKNDVKYVQSYLLVPSVITKENLQLLVNSGLYKWDSENKYLEMIQ